MPFLLQITRGNTKKLQILTSNFQTKKKKKEEENLLKNSVPIFHNF